MELQIDLLRTFLAVIDADSFTNASQIVHRSQSAISLQIKRLEETTGHMLFERIGRSFRLTPEGETLVPYARRMIKLHEEAMGAMSNSDVHGSVRIGIIPDYAMLFLPKLLTQFTNAYPNVQISVRCDPSTVLNPAIAKGEVDLAIVTGEPTDTGLVIRREPALWVTSNNHLTHEKNPVPLAIFHTKCTSYTWPRAALDTISRSYRIAYESPAAAGLMAAVTSGLAVAVLYKSMITDDLRVLGPEDGFPELPEAKILLKRFPGARSQAVEYMAQDILEVMK